MSNKEKQIKVTIGLCVKNSEGIVKHAIDSLLNQNFSQEDSELIIVDGNSKDRTIEIIKERLKKTTFSVKIFSENSGLGIARQTVVNQASGEYIIWVDADTILPESYISNQVAFIDNNPTVGIAAGKYAVNMGQGVVADLENIVYAVDSIYGEKSASKYGYLPAAEGSIFKLKAIRQIGGFDIRITGAAEDTEVAYRMIDKGWKVVKTREKFPKSSRQSWSSLWCEYFWYGRGAHFIFHKNCNSISLWKMTPIAGFFAGILRLPKAYLIVHEKAVILLPIHYTYKRIAWFFGFLNAHFHGYGHFRNKNNF